MSGSSGEHQLSCLKGLNDIALAIRHAFPQTNEKCILS